MLDAHIDGGLGCTVAGIRVPRSQATEFGVIDAARGQQDQGVPGEAGRPARAAGRSRGVVRLDGQLHLHQRRADRGAVLPTRRTRTPGTTWAATSSRASCPRGEAQVYDFTNNEVPGSTDRTGPTGATWGRSTPTTRPTWIWSRSTRCSTSTTMTGRSGPIRCSCPGPSSPWRAPPPTRSSARLHHLRRLDRRLRAVAQRPGGQRRRDQPVGDPANATDRRGRRDRAGDPGQERGGASRAPRSGSTIDQDRARGYTVSDGGITVVGKGITVRA